MCLLHNFPNLIEHTIQWARDNFAGLFTNPAQQTEEFLKNPKEFAERTAKSLSDYDRNEIIQNVKLTLGQERPQNFKDCIKWVSILFTTVVSKDSRPLFSSLEIFFKNNFITQSHNYYTISLMIKSQPRVNVFGVEINDAHMS